MPRETTCTNLRRQMAAILETVTANREVVIVRRRGHADVALLPADELAGLLETAHLLRSPKNARRLLTALRRAEERRTRPSTVETLRKETGLAAGG